MHPPVRNRRACERELIAFVHVLGLYHGKRRPQREHLRGKSVGMRKITPIKSVTSHSAAGAMDAEAEVVTADDATTLLAKKYWAGDKVQAYNVEVVQQLFNDTLRQRNFSNAKISILENSGFLERYLWPNFDATAPREVVISILLMINEKYLEGQDALACIERTHPERFAALVDQALTIALEDATAATDKATIREQTTAVIFLIRCFQSLEKELVRKQVQPLVGLGTWRNLLPSRREQAFEQHPRLKKGWKAIHKKRAKLPADEQAALKEKEYFFGRLIAKFLDMVDTLDATRKTPQLQFCERTLELLVDVEALLTSRRYLNTVVQHLNVVTRCETAPIATATVGNLFGQLLQMLKFYVNFEIDDLSGEQLSEDTMTDIHYAHVKKLQTVAYRHYEELRELALRNVSSIDTRETFVAYMDQLSDERLRELCASLALIADPTAAGSADDEECPAMRLNSTAGLPRERLLQVLADRYQRRYSQLESINEMSLFPTEQTIWDTDIVPDELYVDACLALPKLHLQFLTLFDYLLRNLNLFNMESIYEIRMDLEDHLPRLQPYLGAYDEVKFAGWSKMAHPIDDFRVVAVAQPRVGESHPATVRADVVLKLDSVRDSIRQEWEALRRHDVGFLYGVVAVRGCEVEGMLDAQGQLIDEYADKAPTLSKSRERTFRLLLDPNQYQQDIEASMHGEGYDVYSTFNVFVRRNSKENNFKAVLETIRSLMNAQTVVPDWLHDIFLGYGDPGAAHYSKMPDQAKDVDFYDTFVDAEHLRESFPNHAVQFPEGAEAAPPPYKVAFEEPAEDKGKDANARALVKPYTTEMRGPYPQNVPRRNAIRFTPTQTEAIRSGIQHGLTVVVGPPGTGKTDVAVQIINNLYHAHPEQRTLIVTHSNQALNQLFEKIMALDIQEKHLLRLGRGEEQLNTTKDFTRYGRVNFILGHRMELLSEVKRLSETLEDISAQLEYTCETAGHFYIYHVEPRWKKYWAALPADDSQATAEDLQRLAATFPFHAFFANAQQPLFAGQSYAQDVEMARGCQHYIDDIFNTLSEYRAFELLHKNKDRTRYLMVKEARIIAMTCTYAALMREDLASYGFRYDNIVMEESAQILEVETFIPLVLQNPQDGRNLLKRVTLIGDHNQLPPVIRNPAFKKFCNLEQSMFTRFVRLGVPHVQLDAQGRMRPSMADLYRWNYTNLNDLPHIGARPEFAVANPGFRYEYQLIDVGDYQGKGEMVPSPHFIQNLGEAEYVVATYMYMRLLGYPAERITILTTYNGQKELIRDVVRARCLSHPLFGSPAVIETVDKYQGSQNDYVLLSLVRTRHAGFLRDVRRLIVALSRARLGLYIFARVALFDKVPELEHVFNLLKERPTTMQLYPNESYTETLRPVDQASEEEAVVEVTNMEHMAQSVYSMAVERLREVNQGAQEQVHPGNQDEAEVTGDNDDAEVKESEAMDQDADGAEEQANGVSDAKAAPMETAAEPDEEAQPAEEPAPVASESSASASDNETLTEEDVKKMKVAELKEALQARQIAFDSKDRKAELQEHLLKAISS
ncbi:uncharacterized protein MONBRDRAFT_38574 [Monosiga brevicollis MX1]|uniref:Intron-binding protein aquarius n=1 Tax=Monosiga brevicollis TaxID=81824 RepID=A9V8U6_MONBE|nr:uncharacterized protein MONBRDRAFT_38574 [Monosiga brevicollis MX1]EDQ85935.1 predicted protein [Monosiga brevicollis MX1]|eukprot:XP_001749129.1 hypothetical protein [Monosiga brevicollis MX1]